MVAEKFVDSSIRHYDEGKQILERAKVAGAPGEQ